MKHFYFRALQILLWVFVTLFPSLQAKAQYTSSVLETGKYYTAVGKDNQDNIYVTAYNSATTKYQLLKYPSGGGAPTAIYQGLSFSVSEYPWAIAVNSTGDVFIMNPDAASHWQIIKLAAGTYTPSVIQSGNYYTALAVDASDNLLTLEYNATTTSYQVVKYAAASLTGAGTVVYNGLPLATGLGTYPWGIVTDHSNNIYIIDFPNNASNGRLIKLTAPAYGATTLGSGKGYTSLAIDGQDNLYTTETAPSPASTSRIMKYTAPVGVGATGTEIFTGLKIGSLFYPWGLAVDSHGTVYVGDGAATGNGRFLKLTPPSISVSSVTKLNSSPTNAGSVQYTVTFSGAANGVTTSAFTLTTTGISGSSISSVTGSGTTYTVTVNTGSGDGTLRLDVNGTGIGNTVTGLPYTSGDVYTIDKTPPTDTIKTFPPALTNSTVANFTFTASETATFSASLDGGPYNPTTSPLTLTGLASTSHTLRVKATDNAGNVTVTPASYTWTIDNISPAITLIDVPANGIYHLGDGLRFKAHFSESVAVTGTPTLDITIGSTVRQATYQAGSASDTLGFLYIVQSGDLDMDGITLASAIAGTIKDLAGNNSVLTLPAVNTSGVLVNTIHPTVTISTAATSPVKQPFTATITFSEA
ncbi:MAG: hypothetical protein J7623_23260, partial [Chitinophaga sp.]|nr:hypothetical protein [Chitinophaga sp.]